MEENNRELYIILSKTNIDKAIIDNNYHKAFFLLLGVLERLDHTEKVSFIDYYVKQIYYSRPVVSNLERRTPTK